MAQKLTCNDVQRDWIKPPNLVSLVRLALAPFAAWFAMTWLGWVLLLIAVCSDKLDGMLAKMNGGRWTTLLGKVLDSMIDKILVLIVLIAVYAKTFDLMVLMAAMVIGMREIVVSWIKARLPIKSAVEAGRASMVLQSVALLWYTFPPAQALSSQWTSGVMWLAIGASLTSGWVYVTEYRSGRQVV